MSLWKELKIKTSEKLRLALLILMVDKKHRD